MRPLSKAERRQIASQVSCSLCNLREFRAYWLPQLRRVLARSVSITRQFRVPADAVLVGTYEHGIRTADVLADLEELLARLPEPAPRPAPAVPAKADEPGPPATVQAQAPKAKPAHPWRARHDEPAK